MPLIHSASEEAVGKNIAIEKHAHPDMSQKQAIAIAENTKREAAKDEGAGTTALPFQALAPGASAPAADSPEEEAIGREAIKVHEHLHKHMHHHEHHHEHKGETTFGHGEVKFPYEEGSHVGGAEDTASCTEAVSHNAMQDAIRQMYEPESERGENANGIVTPR